MRYLLLLLCVLGSNLMAGNVLVIDDRDSGNLDSALGPAWRLLTDGVMGGISEGTLEPDRMDGRGCLRMQGDVSLENNGGFIQIALSVEDTAAVDASSYSGIALDVYGNDESYNLHLRTGDLWLPWQSYRATFEAPAHWQRVRLPFTDFKPYKTGSELDLAEMERIGIVAIGRAFHADLCVAHVEYY